MIRADIDIPANLPMPVREGNEVQHVQPFMRVNLANGRVRQRRTFMLVPSKQTFQWVLTADEAAQFEAWFVSVAMDGTRWFNMRTKNPLGNETHITARFADMYKGPNIYGQCHFVISAELEVFERSLMPVDWVNDMEWWTFRNELDVLANRTWPAYYADN